METKPQQTESVIPRTRPAEAEIGPGLKPTSSLSTDAEKDRLFLIKRNELEGLLGG